MLLHPFPSSLIVLFCPEMQAVTKISDLTKFCQITRDGSNMLANLTILAIVIEIGILSYPSGADDFDKVQPNSSK